MYPLLSIVRRSLAMGCVAAALVLAGCRSGVSPGEGPGIKSFADGELNGNVQGSVEEAKAAVEQALVQMGVLNAEERRNSVMVEINARTLEERPLDIKISRISDTLTKLRITAGGDRELARSLYQRVRTQLQQQYERSLTR